MDFCVRSVYAPADNLTDRPRYSLCPLDATSVVSHSISELGIYPVVDPLDSKSRILDHHIVRTSLLKGIQGSHNFRCVGCYAGQDNVSNLSIDSLHHDIRQVQTGPCATSLPFVHVFKLAADGLGHYGDDGVQFPHLVTKT
jgi:F0F1-type ATP synthase beta subunit